MLDFHRLGKNVPKYIILGIDKELPAFEQVVCGLSMPTVDVESCFQQIFDIIAIADDVEFNKMLTDTAIYMGKGEGLFSNANLTDQEKEEIILAIMRIGKELKERVLKLNAYIDGYFPYVYFKLLEPKSVVLMLSDELI